jgi:AraC-like DNA-binding protein
MIRFGSMSITLLVGALYGLLFAVLLYWTHRNRAANRFLAMLLVVIALQLLPYIIGYAGFYDAFPWLSYLPYEASLAFGPLLYFYLRSLPAMPIRASWMWHFLPVAIQVCYYAVIFPFPVEFKNAWDTNIHVPFVLPIEQAATLVSMGVYWWLSFKHYREYQVWLANNVSDREDHHIEWVRNFLIALGLTLLLWIGLVAFERLIAKLNYFQQFPFYVWLAVLSYYLGTEGYRNAGHRYPVWRPGMGVGVGAGADAARSPAPTPAEMPTGVAPSPPQIGRDAIDWQERGNRWREQLLVEEWWRDADLTLASLARKLGTNTSDLSRAINEGLGMNFNELINRLRVDAVKAALLAQPGANLLDVAFDAGFSSKASFNRSFKLYAGETPTAWRAAGANRNR